MSLGEAWRRLRSAGYGTALYRARLKGRTPETLLFLPRDPWPGNVERANELFRGQFRFRGREARAPNQPPWRLRPDDSAWTRHLHRFDWLRHFATAGGPTAQAHARRLVRSWIDLCGDYDPLAWAPELTGRRLANWLGQAAFLADGADASFDHAFRESLAMQWRHLSRAAQDAADGRSLLDATLGLVWGALVLPGEEAWRRRAGERLGALLDRQVLADGGYISRSPSDQLGVLRDLIALRDIYGQGGQEPPAGLPGTIQRMAGVLRALRHGDGALGLFNGGYEEGPEEVRDTLQAAGRGGKGVLAGGESRFHQLTAGNASLLVDAGSPPAGAAGFHAHAGTASFEFCVGRQRIITNCGSGVDRSPEWLAAMRHTAAHSTVVIDDADSAELLADGGFGRRPEKLRCRRHEDDGGSVWIDFSHDGYARSQNLVHHRRLFLEGGGDLRGEDALRPVKDGDGRHAGKPFVVRFHLHPDVHASLVHGGAAVLLKLNAGRGWRFRVQGGQFGLEESVYLGRQGQIRRSQQIVVSGTVGNDGSTVKWAFRQT
ncbi:MAG TPA: heparinase II/III family protein [Alphaproteobacteria bacterium]|nr:heparinase II/III family protein [Alphaproteobacteria bacterium]